MCPEMEGLLPLMPLGNSLLKNAKAEANIFFILRLATVERAPPLLLFFTRPG
jgi:hypothetical protein